MTWKNMINGFKFIFFRSWFFYFLLALLCVRLVDTKAVIERFHTRNLNDAIISMEPLVSFNAQEISSQQIEWSKFINYFSLVQKYLPSDPVSKMYLALSNYFALGKKEEAFLSLRQSAESNPIFFWNVYNLGVLFFERGDMKQAADHFQKVLLLPEDKVMEALKLSVVYRQVMASYNFYADPREGVRAVKKDVYLFLSAAYYNSGDYEKSSNIALYALAKEQLPDKEPFYFYAASAELSKGNVEKAMSFFFKCIALDSQNPLVYRQTGQIFKAMGNMEGARAMRLRERSLSQLPDKAFFYKDRLRLRFF